MKVYYNDLSDEEETKLLEAIESVICPNGDEEEHECRLEAITWETLKD
ncbi:hypothetical protein SEA_TARGARYEN_141 [Streptomyces phage Targaryen]|nr:hypothetical protein SEA_TARGARYEN_141 [Streptomyces phage Targaryen]